MAVLCWREWCRMSPSYLSWFLSTVLCPWGQQNSFQIIIVSTVKSALANLVGVLLTLFPVDVTDSFSANCCPWELYHLMSCNKTIALQLLPCPWTGNCVHCHCCCLQGVGRSSLRLQSVPCTASLTVWAANVKAFFKKVKHCIGHLGFPPWQEWEKRPTWHSRKCNFKTSAVLQAVMSVWTLFRPAWSLQ